MYTHALQPPTPLHHHPPRRWPGTGCHARVSILRHKRKSNVGKRPEQMFHKGNCRRPANAQGRARCLVPGNYNFEVTERPRHTQCVKPKMLAKANVSSSSWTLRVAKAEPGGGAPCAPGPPALRRGAGGAV